jgi:hypothetical protein
VSELIELLENLDDKLSRRPNDHHLQHVRNFPILDQSSIAKILFNIVKAKAAYDRERTRGKNKQG